MSGDIPSQISLDNAVVAQDEMGRPFIIVREYLPLQKLANGTLVRVGKKGTPCPIYGVNSMDRLHGTDAIKSHILAAKTVAGILRTSLGPRGTYLFVYFLLTNFRTR